MLVKLYNENPNPAILKQVVDCLNKGGLVIYPTDTVYALGCDIHNKAAIDKVARIKGIKAEKADFSFVFYDLSHISEYTVQFDNTIFRLMKRAFPGAYTFILKAGHQIPKIFKNNKKTIGIRIPDHQIPLLIVEKLGNPILTTSIHHEDEVLDYITDPYAIYERFENIVDIVIDGGAGGIQPSTIIDCSNGIPTITRKGAGSLDIL